MKPVYFILFGATFFFNLAASIELLVVCCITIKNMSFTLAIENTPFILVSIMIWVPVALLIRASILIRSWLKDRGRTLTQAQSLIHSAAHFLLLPILLTAIGFAALSTPWVVIIAIIIFPLFTFILTKLTAITPLIKYIGDSTYQPLEELEKGLELTDV